LGIGLESGGLLRLPLRVFLDRRGRVNLVPIDYFVAAVLMILERAESGGVYHLTSDKPKSIDDLAVYCRAYLRIDGVEILEGSWNGIPPTPPESLFRKLIEPYLPYLADSRRFARTRTDRATSGLKPPELTRDVFDRCMDYAVGVNWGNGR